MERDRRPTFFRETSPHLRPKHTFLRVLCIQGWHEAQLKRFTLFIMEVNTKNEAILEMNAGSLCYKQVLLGYRPCNSLCNNIPSVIQQANEQCLMISSQ